MKSEGKKLISVFPGAQNEIHLLPILVQREDIDDSCWLNKNILRFGHTKEGLLHYDPYL